MKKFKITKSKLSGEVRLDGAKNSALRLLAASILTSEKLVLSNFPLALSDCQLHIRMLEKMGKICSTTTDIIEISQDGVLDCDLIWTERSIRNTLLILGASVARYGYGKVPLPGGCKLGERKHDLHIMLLKAMGAEVWEEGDYLFAQCKGPQLIGKEIHLPIRSTGATENAILCGTLAQGKTVIWNPHVRPEILDLIDLLKKMGANISVYGQERIEVIGVDSLSGAEHDVIPDNMEGITWLMSAALTKSEIEIVNFPIHDVKVVMEHLNHAGLEYFVGSKSIIVKNSSVYPIEISTGPHPGINSDVQPLFAAWGTAASGVSKVIDLRFPGRYAYANELNKLGCSTEVQGDMLVIKGNGGTLVGNEVRALDLRAGAALVMCGLIASGETIIHDAWQIERGYNNFVPKLKALGGNIELI